jgi:hypothetical protein
MKHLLFFLIIASVNYNFTCDARSYIFRNEFQKIGLINQLSDTAQITDTIPVPSAPTDCYDLDVIPFAQNDGTWNDDDMAPNGMCEGVLNGHRFKIGPKGCAITSISMLINASGQYTANPQTVNNYCNDRNDVYDDVSIPKNPTG